MSYTLLFAAASLLIAALATGRARHSAKYSIAAGGFRGL
jgi:hypothetical protein